MPEFSPVSFSEVWERTLRDHPDDIFLIFENPEEFDKSIFIVDYILS